MSTTIHNYWKKASLTKTDAKPQNVEQGAKGSLSELRSKVAEQLAVDPSVTFDDYPVSQSDIDVSGADHR